MRISRHLTQLSPDAKNRDVTDDIFRAPYMFCVEFFGTGRSTNLSLERVDYFGTSEYFSGRKNKKLFVSKTSMVRLRVQLL